MGILAADFLIGCQHFAKSKRRDRLLSAQGDGRCLEHTLCEAVPRVVVRRASPPGIVPTRSSWPCTLPPPRASSSPSRRLYIYLVVVGLPSAMMREGDDDAWGGDRGDTTRAGEETSARGDGAPRRGRARGGRRGGATTRGTLSHMNARPPLLTQPSLVLF